MTFKGRSAVSLQLSTDEFYRDASEALEPGRAPGRPLPSLPARLVRGPQRWSGAASATAALRGGRAREPPDRPPKQLIRRPIRSSIDRTSSGCHSTRRASDGASFKARFAGISEAAATTAAMKSAATASVDQSPGLTP